MRPQTALLLALAGVLAIPTAAADAPESGTRVDWTYHWVCYVGDGDLGAMCTQWVCERQDGHTYCQPTTGCLVVKDQKCQTVLPVLR